MVDAISDAVESANNSISFAETSEWNGKDVQALPQTRAWLVLQIPIQTPNPLPNLGQRVTAVNSRALPTVEEVLNRHGLEFASPWNNRDIKQLPTSDHGWVVIPLHNSEGLESLQERVYIDANNYRNVERILERQGFYGQVPPFSSTSNLV